MVFSDIDSAIILVMLAIGALACALPFVVVGWIVCLLIQLHSLRKRNKELLAKGIE